MIAVAIFRVHLADGQRRDVEAASPDEARKRFSDGPVAVAKVKLLRDKRESV